MRGKLSCITFAAAVFLAGAAYADWPMSRGDPRRTGAGGERGDLRTPLPYWRYFLGGNLGSGHVIPLEGEEVASVSGGRVRVTSVHGIERWASDNLGITQLVAYTDLDGDAVRELVVQSSNRVFVFDLDGTMHWGEPPGEMGTIGGVRAADLDGVPGAELVIMECFCCQVRGPIPGLVYSFADSVSSPRELWRLTAAACAGSRAMVIADVTGDGRDELVVSSQNDIRILAGATGAELARSAHLGSWVSASYCEPADVLPGAGQELICALGYSAAPAGTGHRVYALAFRTTPARLDVIWEQNVGDLDAELRLGHGHVVDLDGDGSFEVTVTGTRGDGVATTSILDAASGQVLATIDEQESVGAVLSPAAAPVYLTQASQQIQGWRFRRDAPVRLEPLWRLKNRRSMVGLDWELARKQPLATRLIHPDVDDSGTGDLFTIDTKRPSDLNVYDIHASTETNLRSWSATAGAQILAGWRTPERLTTSTSDGRISTLTLTGLVEIGSFRAGQYYDRGGWLDLTAGPVVANLMGTQRPELAVVDSRGVLVALGVAGATNASPPRRLWERAASQAPTIAPNLGQAGGPGLVCRSLDLESVPPTEKLVRVDGGGALLWEVPLGAQVFNDPVLGNFDGDDIPDISIQWGNSDDLMLQTTAYAGSTGARLWTTTTGGGAVRIPSGHAVADWNGDGTDDVVFHHFGLYVLSGVDGTTLATNAPSTVTYALPTLRDVDGDGAYDVLLSGSFFPARLLGHDLAVRWVSNDNDRPYPYAALATCGGRELAVATSLLRPSTLKVTEQAGAAIGRAAAVVLADGALYPDEATALAAGALGGQLTSVYVHPDLTGDGRPSAVVGSSDGWLYALDPCTMMLDFAVPFAAPVGAVAFGDLDADGLDELVVSVADGYLYGVRNAPLPPPAWVRDLDPLAMGAEDVDEVETRDTLSASWDPVPGAAAYDVAVVDADGNFVTSPAWIRVAATTMTQAGLTLQDRQRYDVAVRAVSAAGVSPDRLSDGVLVRHPPAPAPDGGPDADPGPPSGAGGCCDAADTSSAALALFALPLIGIRRRLRPAPGPSSRA